MFSFVMVVATITLVGIVGFRFLDKQDNTQIANKAAESQQVASVSSVKDVDTVTKQLDTTELDTLDAKLDEEFKF